MFTTRKIGQHLVGDVVRLNRTRGLVSPVSGEYGPVVVRIIRKTDNLATNESTIEAVTNLGG